MPIYAIKVPSISNGLRKSYNKQLEVYEIDFEQTSHNHNVGYATGIKCWEYDLKGSKEWKVSKGRFSERVNINLIKTDIITSSNHDVVLFDNLENAQVSKILLVNQLRKHYEDEIENIRKLYEKNVPDLSDEVEDLKQKYPEKFI